LIDIYPTLCSYLDVPCPEALSGTSWLEPFPGEKEFADRYRISEGVMFRPQNRALRVGDLKLLYQPDPSPDGAGNRLFDLARDPGETHDLSREPDYLAIYGALSAVIDEAIPAIGPLDVDRVPLTQEEQDRLRSLGYVR
jgi:arylsulfatase A-like enzyme